MNQIIAEYGANTIYAANLIREAGASSQAIAGFLTILAPVIAFAIAKGSDFATAQLAASVMAPAQSAAQSQGASLTSGNISLGNTSWGNVSTNTQSGNKSDRSMGFTDSSMLQTASAYGSVTRNASGAVTGMSMTPVSMGVSSAMSLGEANSQSATSSMSNSFGYSDSIQALRSYTTQTADKSMAGFTRLLNTTLNRQSGLQSANSSLDEASSSITSSSNQTIESNFNNGQTATIRSSVSFSSGSSTNLEKANPSIQSNLSVQNSAIKDTNNINSSVGKTTGLENIRQSLINGGNPSSLSSSAIGQLQTTQQLVDSVSQQNNASNNKQRQEAYKSLLTATRQIAESTSDSGIRNAAQNFERQLTRAYQLGNRQSFEQSASLGASSQIGYDSNQDIRTMMDSSPAAMQMAIETFGSAEAAQNALFHSASARKYFAQQLHQSMDQSDWNNNSPQPLSTVGIDTMARPHRESFKTEKFNQFDQTRQANNLDYQISKQSSIGDKEISDLPQTSAVTNSVNNFRESMNADKTQLQSSLLTERGTTFSAKAVYEEKQSGVPTVFANAYLGGALYSSPHEYKDQLTEKTNSESFRKAMQEIGKQDKAELSEVERSAQK